MAHSFSSSRIALDDFCKPTPLAQSNVMVNSPGAVSSVLLMNSENFLTRLSSRLRGTLTSFACWCVWALSFFSHCALTAGFARQVRSEWRKVGVSPTNPPPPPKQQPASRTPRNCKYVLRRGRVGRKFKLTQTTTSNVLTCGSHIEHTHRSQCTTYA